MIDARILRVSREAPRMSLRVAAMAGIQPWGLHMGVEPKIMVPQNGWFIRENPIEMDDLGVPLLLETPIFNPMKCEGSSNSSRDCLHMVSLACSPLHFGRITNI